MPAEEAATGQSSRVRESDEASAAADSAAECKSVRASLGTQLPCRQLREAVGPVSSKALGSSGADESPDSRVQNSPTELDLHEQRRGEQEAASGSVQQAESGQQRILGAILLLTQESRHAPAACLRENLAGIAELCRIGLTGYAAKQDFYHYPYCHRMCHGAYASAASLPCL